MLSPSLRSRFLALTEPLEGRKSWLYLDVKRLLTTGLGCLVPRLSVMLSLPWQKSDGSPATEAEKRAEWARVGMMAGGQVATRYWTPDALVLSEEAIDALAGERLEVNAALLAAHWPEWPSFPEAAQLACLMMAWALGAFFPSSWPLFSARVSAQDWAGAARECRIPGANAARNEATARLLGEAEEEARALG